MHPRSEPHLDPTFESINVKTHGIGSLLSRQANGLSRLSTKERTFFAASLIKQHENVIQPTSKMCTECL